MPVAEPDVLSSSHRHDRPYRPGLRRMRSGLLWLLVAAVAGAFGWAVAHPNVSGGSFVEPVSGIYQEETASRELVSGRVVAGVVDGQFLARQAKVTVETTVRNDGRWPVVVWVDRGADERIVWSRVTVDGATAGSRTVARAALGPGRSAVIRVSVEVDVCSGRQTPRFDTLPLKVATGSVPVSVTVPLAVPVVFRADVMEQRCS